MPKSASTIEVRLPYLYLCLEIIASLKMGAGVNAFDREFNGIDDFDDGIQIGSVIWRIEARGAIVV